MICTISILAGLSAGEVLHGEHLATRLLAWPGLAQFAPHVTGDQVLTFVAIAFGLLGIYNQAQAARNHGKPREIAQPLEVREATRFADKSDTERRLTALEGDVRSLRGDVHRSEQAILKAGEERAVLIHNRINATSEKVDHLSGQIEQLTAATREATKAAHEAAIQAARVGAKSRA